jgi:hypothetical protein
MGYVNKSFYNVVYSAKQRKTAKRLVKRQARRFNSRLARGEHVRNTEAATRKGWWHD